MNCRLFGTALLFSCGLSTSMSPLEAQEVVSPRQSLGLTGPRRPVKQGEKPAERPFRPSPPKTKIDLGNEQASADCGNGNLSKEMTPAKAQVGTWCATYVATSLIENHVFKTTKKPTIISVIDVNGANSRLYGAPGEMKRTHKYLNLNYEGSNPVDYLEGVQRQKKLYSEDQLPFESTAFKEEMKDQIAQLANFYRRQTGDRTCRYDANMLAKVADLKILTNIARSSLDEADFIKSVSISSAYFRLPKPTSDRSIDVPPFDIHSKSYKSSDLKRQISHLISQRTPFYIGICAYRLEQKISRVKSPRVREESRQDECGNHAILVIGMQRDPQTGRCQVLLQNSKGANWPSINANPGGGRLWLNYEDFVSSLEHPDRPRLVWLEPTKDEGVTHQSLTNDNIIAAPTWHGKIVGPGVMMKPTGEVIERGNFRFGKDPEQKRSR